MGGATAVPNESDIRRAEDHASLLVEQEVAKAKASQPQDTEEWNELVRYDEVIQLWDENKKGRERHLMIILDCCFSGRWVRRVNGEPEDELANPERRDSVQNLRKKNDVCIQAACRPNEKCGVTDSQLCSTFTREFIDAMNRNLFEKLFISTVDHLLVGNFVSMWCSRPAGESFTPLSSDHTPFPGFRFFNSFDDMLLQT